MRDGDTLLEEANYIMIPRTPGYTYTRNEQIKLQKGAAGRSLRKLHLQCMEFEQNGESVLTHHNTELKDDLSAVLCQTRMVSECTVLISEVCLQETALRLRMFVIESRDRKLG